MLRDNAGMKQIALIRDRFNRRWRALGEISHDYADNWRRFADDLNELLHDVFWMIFEEAKKELRADPGRFARETASAWALAANQEEWPLPEWLWGNWNWDDILSELERSAWGEIERKDLVYLPTPTLSLENISRLPARSPELCSRLSEMHPHLVRAMKALLASEGCATVDEAVQTFPVLRGITETELEDFRGTANSRATVAAARELLNVRLPDRTPGTIDKYFRPKVFRRK